MFVVMDTAAGEAVDCPHSSAEGTCPGGSKKEIVLWRSTASPRDGEHCVPQSDNENGIPPGFPSYRFLRLEHFFNSVIDPASAGLDPSKAVTKC